MRRLITKKLADWKISSDRKPLIVRGARQVGKTWSILNFGHDYFEGNTHKVDLEKNPDWHIIFEKNLDVKRIISELELFLNVRINPGKDLLFIDEIQNCPRAIMALRYFYEEMPDLHVIAAGSLLEFALKEISFPVGRVQFLDMVPLSFSEYLIATGKERAAEKIQGPPKKLSDPIHRMFLAEVKNYFFVGGMPECVSRYSENRSFKEVFDLQSQLVDTFRQDFSKYAPYSDKRCLNTVLTQVAKSVGQQIVYTKLAEGFSSSTNKKALDLLSMARIIYRVPAASPAGVPLAASASTKKFKTIFLDIGLMNHICGLNVADEFSKMNLLAIYRGAMAEQFVGQEIIAAGNTPYYWSREAKSSTAEIDFLLARRAEILPIEVKASASGRLRSLHLLLKQFDHIKAGYVISEANQAELTEQKLVFLPIYFTNSFADEEIL